MPHFENTYLCVYGCVTWSRKSQLAPCSSETTTGPGLVHPLSTAKSVVLRVGKCAESNIRPNVNSQCWPNVSFYLSRAVTMLQSNTKGAMIIKPQITGSVAVKL